MNLEIESSEITRFDTFDRGDGKRYELPIVSKRNIKSVVIVPSAQQLYIGGLYTNNTGDLVRKVPILGDVPGLGILLRGFNKKKRQSETVFQITPTIMRPGQGFPPKIISFVICCVVTMIRFGFWTNNGILMKQARHLHLTG